jgi:hypothetical protein
MFIELFIADLLFPVDEDANGVWIGSSGGLEDD